MTSTLTPREYEVLEAYARLGKMRAVAGELGISINTANTHCQSAFRKLDATCETEAFIAIGWLRLPDEDERRRSIAGLTLEQATIRAADVAAQLHSAIAVANTLRSPGQEPRLSTEASAPVSSLRRVV